MQAAVFPNEPYDESPEDDIPELPIPRPGEQRVPLQASRLKPPRLGDPSGGGASYTANDRIPRTIAQQQALDAERFTWELASRLTAGMLSNPSRSGASVKDAMNIFDDVLQEMHEYVRIATDNEHDADAPVATRGDYFHTDGTAPRAETRPATPATPAAPATPAPAPSTAATPIQPVKPYAKPRPMQPRPSDEYWAEPRSSGRGEVA